RRPSARFLIAELFDDFVELHGDRCFGDDPALIGGLATLGALPVTVLAIDKGAEVCERLNCNFGGAHPEGYRKAVRLMKQAEKFGRPVITLIDTAGAFCGIEAEERGQASAIATSILTMTELRVPTIALVVGQGGSGGALALAAADRVWMARTATYSVISPEGCASILFKDAGRAREAAECLKLTADDLQGLGVIDGIVEERPLAGPSNYFDYFELRERFAATLTELAAAPSSDLVAARETRLRGFGREGL
ncbi:MAG: acetyl-CoA carboxylase carboxyl transferase subunit alpha, partial [Actinomycetia bacterium]|nr:acetyl-CoA carboxylase carboxyl transferase subunit alpha [Actinomycetes bacterium]